MKTKLHSLFIVLAFLASIHQGRAQFTGLGTAFNYQGQLQDTGTNASASYTMIFKLYDSATSGNEVGSPITDNLTLTNGLFNVTLDFGQGAFTGFARWLDITITNGGTGEELSPRVEVLPTPYAQYAAASAQISGLSGILNGTNLVSANYWFAGIEPGDTNFPFRISDNGSDQMVVSNNDQGVFFPNNVYSGGTFNGDGGGLTGLHNVPDIEVFDTNGIFVVPTNVTKIMVEVWGGGGGGQSDIIQISPGAFGATTNNFQGAGGGGGGYGKETFEVTPGETCTVTVGLGGDSDAAGGTSSLDFTNEVGEEETLISATGGLPGTNSYFIAGSNNAGEVTNFYGNGGSGGYSDALINILGGSGGTTVRWANEPYPFGFGNGGNAGAGGSGGHGDYGVSNDGPEDGHVPGGGGGGGFAYTLYYIANPFTESFTVPDPGGSGGHGRVIVYY